MAESITLAYRVAGVALYTLLIAPNGTSYVKVGGSVEAPNASHWTDYIQGSADTDIFGNYAIPFPAGLPAGRYLTRTYRRLGGSPASTDRWVGRGVADWDGTKLLDPTNVTGAELSDEQIEAIAAGVAADPIFTTISDGVTGVADTLAGIELGSGSVQVNFTTEPHATISVVGLGTTSADEDGLASRSLDPGTYTVKTRKSGFSFDDVSITVTSPGPQSVSLPGDAVEFDEAATPGMCIPYLLAANQSPNEVATLTYSYLPQTIDGAAVVFDSQSKKIVDGRFTFDDGDGVPRGSVIQVELKLSKTRGTYTIPDAASYSLPVSSLANIFA